MLSTKISYIFDKYVLTGFVLNKPTMIDIQ